MRKSPCTYCTDKRHLGCHDTCKDYKDWHQEIIDAKIQLSFDKGNYRSSATNKMTQKNRKKYSAKYMKNKFQEDI